MLSPPDRPPGPPAGTQVVARVEIRGSGGAVVHPCGAVGIVTRTPAVTGEPWLVRFPDGFEQTLRAGEFEPLREWQEPGSIPLADGLDLAAATILEVTAGSRAHGMGGEDSDTDVRGVFLAPAEMTWSLFGAPEIIEDHAAQAVHWELRKFLVLALKANPAALEVLWSPLVRRETNLGAALRALRPRLLSTMVFQTYNGYALSQFKKIEQDRRNLGEVRWKHAMHLLRLLLTGAAALRSGEVPVRVEESAAQERLLAVKRGEVPWDEVEAWRRELHAEFERALAAAAVPDRPDYAAANAFLLRARRGAAG